MGGIVVSLSIRRLGSVPVFDPTFATPLVYITSVLEVNMAIICASIPIFWPLGQASFGKNNILVVNEIVVKTDSGDAVRNAGPGRSVDTADANGLSVLQLGGDGRASHMETKVSGKQTVTSTAFGKEAEGYDSPKSSRKPMNRFISGLGRHRTKVSNSSNDALFGIEVGRKVSQESH